MSLMKRDIAKSNLKDAQKWEFDCKTSADIKIGALIRIITDQEERIRALEELKS